MMQQEQENLSEPCLGEKQTVWPVWIGEYSDAHVIAVFSTEALSEAFFAQYSGGEAVPQDYVYKPWLGDEWVVDAEIGGWADEWRVCLGMNGDLVSENSDRVLASATITRPHEYRDHNNVFCYRAYSRKSRDHALKLAAELRQAHLRNKSIKPEGE